MIRREKVSKEDVSGQQDKFINVKRRDDKQNE